MTPVTTQRRATIIHGYSASPEDHWFGWLGGRLGAAGIPATIPPLPNSKDPDPTEWADAVRRSVGTPDENSIIVAHSLGCLTVLRHLRSLRTPWRVGTLVLVSGFVDPLPAFPELDAFIGAGCATDGISTRVDRLTLLRSDADPYVPPAHTDRLAALLDTTAQIVPGAAHFLASDGITTLAEAFEAIGPS